MKPVEILEQKVRALYEDKLETRADLADLLYESHVFVVARNAKLIAQRFGGDPDVAYAAGMLHDIADASMKRENPEHEAESTAIASRLMIESGFDKKQIDVVTLDALPRHSCRGDERPSTLEGKALSTADALAHLTTDFYVLLTNEFKKRRESGDEIRQWVKEKIDRDLYEKIQYEEVRVQAREGYENIKARFNEATFTE